MKLKATINPSRVTEARLTGEGECAQFCTKKIKEVGKGSWKRHQGLWEPSSCPRWLPFLSESYFLSDWLCEFWAFSGSRASVRCSVPRVWPRDWPWDEDGASYTRRRKLREGMFGFWEKTLCHGLSTSPGHRQSKSLTAICLLFRLCGSQLPCLTLCYLCSWSMVSHCPVPPMASMPTCTLTSTASKRPQWVPSGHLASGWVEGGFIGSHGDGCSNRIKGGTFQYVSFLDECPAYHYAIEQRPRSNLFLV